MWTAFCEVLQHRMTKTTLEHRKVPRIRGNEHREPPIRTLLGKLVLLVDWPMRTTTAMMIRELLISTRQMFILLFLPVFFSRVSKTKTNRSINSSFFSLSLRLIHLEK